MKQPITFMKDLSLRSLIIGLLGSLVITSSSMYVALRMGALPWPTLFAAVLSMAVLKRWGNATLTEINVTHTAMSSGAMVAGGIAFTLPGLWMLYPDAQIPAIQLIALTVSGALLGAVFTNTHRRTYINEQNLPFPMGTAAYNTLRIGDAGGKQAVWLFTSMGASALFTAFRDGLKLIPGAFTAKLPIKHAAPLSFWLSPMAAGIGFIIGPLYTGVWVLGAVLGYYLLVPVGIQLSWFADAGAADGFRQLLGIGLMVGTGAGIFLKAIYQALRTRHVKRSRPADIKLLIIISASVVLLLWALTDITILQLLLAILGIWLTTSMAAMLTGQTAINPMEIFGILVLLGITLIQKPGPSTAFMLAGLTAVACGLTGDVMNDFKSGHMLGTNPHAQLLAETAGALLGAVVSIIVLLAMKSSFGGFGTEALPAPQAAAVSQMVSGIANVPAFLIGMSLGIILFLAGLPSSTLGLGVYLPVSISSIVFLGGLIRWILSRISRTEEKKEQMIHNGSIVASGFLGGEGITGVLLAILSIF